MKRQREAAIALEDDTVIAFHDGFEPTEELAKRLAEANRDWDKLLLRLYALNAPAADAVTLALFAEHRGHLRGTRRRVPDGGEVQGLRCR